MANLTRAVLVSPDSRHLLPELPERWRLVEVEAAGYTVWEQLAVPLAAVRAGVRVLHVPHYVIPVVFPGRVIVTIHDIIHVLFPEFLRHVLGFAYARFLIRAAVRRSSRVITVSRTTADDLRRLFGADEARLRVIPNGIHETFFAAGDAAEDEALRARLGVRQPYFLHVGNHKPHKNVEGVLKVFIALFLSPVLGMAVGYLLTRLTKPGQKIKVPSFDPVSLSGRESLITYHGQEKTFVRRRLKVLHHFTEAVAGMRSGCIDPQPPADGCPAYCGARAFCRERRVGRDRA